MSLLDKFVVLEGLDGAGTTTQLEKLEKYCQKHNIPCLKTFEPSDGFIGLAARAVLEKKESASPLSLAQLFAADRREHQKRIQKALQEGKWVFCDRYFFSSLAYQSLNMDFNTVLELNKEFPLPRYCLYFKCSVETSARRRGNRENIDLYEKEALQIQVEKNYDKAFQHFYAQNDGLYRIDGEQSIDSVFESIKEILHI